VLGLPIVKENASNKRIYQLSHGNNWESTLVFKVLGPTLNILLLYIHQHTNDYLWITQHLFLMLTTYYLFEFLSH